MDGTGAVIREYVYLNGQLLAVLDQVGGVTEVAYVHTDHLATPIAMSDESGAEVWRASYDPFGEAAVDAGSTAGLNVRFPGQYFDAESGMHHNYFRDYDAGMGRYVESDPIGLAGGPNTYTYVRGNPINRVDPRGLLEWKGKFWSMLGGLRGATAGVFVFNLTSECGADGKQLTVKVYADGLGFGYSGFQFSETGGQIEFEDSLSTADENVFNGSFLYFNASVAYGIGIGGSKILLGGARSTSGLGAIAGLDFGSVSELYGESRVLNAVPKDCECSQ